MKFVTKAELWELPKGTIYQEFGKCGLGPPMVFGGHLNGIDYVEASLLPEENHCDVGHPPEILARFGLTSADYAIWYPSGFGRNGLFTDAPDCFLVWEQADREQLAAWLLDPAKCAEQMNEDAYAMVKADWNCKGGKT